MNRRSPGELGRIVITDLFNYAFPILRYDNGDTAVATRKEKNGRYRLYLDELYGRRSDLIYDCEGKAVTPYIITNNLWDTKGLKQYSFYPGRCERLYHLVKRRSAEDESGRNSSDGSARIWVKKPEQGGTGG